MTLTKRSSDGYITFTEDSHSYISADGEKYTSVTTLLGKLFPPFNAKEIAKKKADFQKLLNGRKWKKGETVSELEQQQATQKHWLNEWKEAANHGTRCHNALENYCNGQPDTSGLKEERDHKKYEQGVKAIEWRVEELGLSKEDIKWETEVIVYNKELLVAGQVDLVARVGGKAFILDWKTSKKISMEGYKGKKGISPITSHLDSCEYIKYSLQLGVYKRMKELKGEDIGECYIVHLLEDDFEIYQCKDLSKEIDDLFTTRKEELQKQKL